MTGTAVPGCGRDFSRGELRCGRGSGAACRRIGEIATAIVDEQHDGNDLDAGALTEGDAVDDGLQAQERQDVAVELGVVKAVRPGLIRARPRERRDDEEEAHQDDEECEGATHRAAISRKDRAELEAPVSAALREKCASSVVKVADSADAPYRIESGSPSFRRVSAKRSPRPDYRYSGCENRIEPKVTCGSGGGETSRRARFSKVSHRPTVGPCLCYIIITGERAAWIS